MKHLSKSMPVKRISPGQGHYFFGYYDLQPYSADESLYLAHKSGFRNRLQQRDDSVEVGFIDMKTEKFERIDTTYAWNFQQGALLQWNPQAADKEVIYNALIDREQHGVVTDIYTGEKKILDRPIANLSRDGKYAISINMSRLYNFRPGYGYAWPGDPFYYENHSPKDGVFIIDMATGKSKLVLSKEEIWDFSGAYFEKDQKLIINHITFNPSASRFVALIRNFPAKGYIERIPEVQNGYIYFLDKKNPQVVYSEKDVTELYSRHSSNFVIAVWDIDNSILYIAEYDS